MLVDNMTLEVREIEKAFRGEFTLSPRKVLHGVSFDARGGEILGFLGSNGAGKTTTIKIILGLIRPDAGEVRIFGRDAGDRKALARLGYLPENPYFFPHLTMREFLVYCGSMSGMDRKALSSRCDEVISLTDMSEAADRRLKGFSKGMLQRAGLAQAILHDPDLLILDEPFSGLDPLGRKLVREILLELRSRGKTIFFSSHILPDMEALCDRTVIIRGGVVVRSAGMDEIFRMADKIELTAGDCSRDVIDGIVDYIEDVSSMGDQVILRIKKQEYVRTVIQHLYNNRAEVLKVAPVQQSLEDVFIREMSGGDDLRGNAADRVKRVVSSGKEA
ncbi:MAG TPA: ABC transporter ATP-binding protein [Candidatus Krumholzibacterium sp.]|nr:ABC transporter ATP-binding protein [Candidatus Krumholzibacterium sp.]